MDTKILPICCIQKIVLYETKARYYLVGSNTSQTKFRVLKIDRTVPYELAVIDDKVEYDSDQIKQLLAMINDGNTPKNPKAYDKDSTGLHRTVSAFGIVGFIRFLEGYYIILISKRKRVAQLGGHAIFKVMDTCMVSIPNETVKTKYHHDGESKYLKAFQNIDLSSNFYFSYSYDLTQSLQYNMSLLENSSFNCSFCECQCHSDTETLNEKDKVNDCAQKHSEVKTDLNKQGKNTSTKCEIDLADVDNGKATDSDFSSKSQRSQRSATLNNVCNAPQDSPGKEKSGSTDFLDGEKNFQQKGKSLCKECTKKRAEHHHTVSGRGKPCMKFVWNKHMLKDVETILHSHWLLHITHGFIEQCNISVYGRPIYLTLIARRSNEYAGTRFLKRGSNDSGYVANDVETEQIVHDASTLSFKSGGYTSFVQLRGSVPLFWSQELQHGVVPKPQIQVDRSDPYASAASQHFNNVLQRFGSPIIVFNLVKKKERKRHEQILGEEFKRIVDYLNQFLPPRHKIKYIWFDIARYSKNKDVKVVEKLHQYAEQFVESVGFFHSGQDLYANDIRPDERWLKVGGYRSKHVFGREQAGVLRVNCVDCLDRTNIAQFVVGKHVLGLQLYALGVIDKPVVNFECDAVRLLEDLYEDQGDTLAVQYGGSQLVHRINTYLKTAPWTSYSRDIYQTVKRYYSGAFTDSEKQQAINLFLGKFIPGDNCLPLWDHPTDYYFHHVSNQVGGYSSQPEKSYTKWFDDDVVATLPLSCLQVKNRNSTHLAEERDELDKEHWNDLFCEYYQPNELSEFELLFSFNLPSSYRLFLPATEIEPSPFVVRATGGGSANKHRLSTKPSSLERSSSPTNEDLSSGSDSSSDSDSDDSPSSKKDSYSKKDRVLFEDIFSNMKNYYGFEIVEPNEASREKYQSFVAIGHNANKPVRGMIDVPWEERNKKEITQEFSYFYERSKSNVTSALMYQTYVDNCWTGEYTISQYSNAKYESFVKCALY